MQEHELRTFWRRTRAHSAPLALAWVVSWPLSAGCGGEGAPEAVEEPSGASSEQDQGPAPLGEGPFGALVLRAEPPPPLEPRSVEQTEQLDELLAYDHRDQRPQITTLRRRLSLSPDDAALQQEMGAVLHGMGLEDMAEGEFLRALALDDGLAQSHRLLGNVYWSRGWHGRALWHLERAIELAPRIGDAYVLAGYVLREANEPAAAIRVADHGLGVEADHAGLLVLRAYLHMDEDELDAACGLLERAVARDRDSERAHLLLSQAYFLLGRDEEAHEYEVLHDRLVTLNNAGAFRLDRVLEGWERAAILASHHRATGREDLAREELARSHSLRPDNHAARIVEAHLVWDAGDARAAVELARGVVAEDGRHTRGLKALARFLLESRGEGQEGLEEALQAAGTVVLITGRTDVDSLELLADVHAARGEEDASQAAWRDLLLVDPQHPRARSALGLEE